MTHKQPDTSSGKKPTADTQPTTARKAFAAALKAECTSRGFGPRPFARQVKDADPSTISRYLSGERVAPEQFIDRLAEEAHRAGKPLAPATVEKLKKLREAALRHSGHANYQLQARVEELQDQLQAMTVRFCLAREDAEVQQHLRADVLHEHRTVLTRLQQFQDDLAAAHDRLVNAQTAQDRLEEENTAMRRQLRAAAAYVQDLETRLRDSEHQRTTRTQTIRHDQQQAVPPRPDNHPRQEAAPRTPGIAPARPRVDRPATPDRKNTAVRNNLRWAAALTSLLGSFALIFTGMSQVEAASHLTGADALLPGGGLLSLLFIAAPLAGRAATAEAGDTEKDGHSSDTDDHVYGYYPLM